MDLNVNRMAQNDDWDWTTVMAEIEIFENEMRYKELLEKESRDSFNNCLQNMKGVRVVDSTKSMDAIKVEHSRTNQETKTDPAVPRKLEAAMQLSKLSLRAPTTHDTRLISKFDKLSIKGSKPLSDYRVVISNLHSKVTQDDIEVIFSDIGEIHEARLLQPGLAEVHYKSEQNAQKAVETFLNMPLDGRPIKCWIASNN